MVQSILEDASRKTISHLIAKSATDSSELAASMGLASAKANQPLAPTGKAAHTNAKDYKKLLRRPPNNQKQIAKQIDQSSAEAILNFCRSNNDFCPTI